jgi:hypothetical protein
MGINTRFTTADDATAASLDITWTANEPTAGNTQTIADGDTPTVAELGQAVANLTAIVNELIVDNASLRAALNAGEGS